MTNVPSTPPGPFPRSNALYQSEDQFQLLVQGVADYAIYMLDPDGLVSSWNVGAERIKGYAADEVVGSHFSRFYTDGDRLAGEPEKNLAVALREGRVEAEGWRQRKDASRFWAHVVIDRILDNDGALVGFAKITRDVSEQRAASQALEAAKEALFQSQKMEAIGQLSGGMAHDFNNLLMAIQSCLELLRSRIPSDAKTIAIFDAAMSSVGRGASLTQRMLAFARRQELTPVAVDMIELVRGMADLVQSSLGSRVTVTTRFPLKLAPVLADANQVELAVLNLVVNARDAMPDGGTLTFAARMESVGDGHATHLKTGDYVCLALTDTGEGMDTGTLARATDPFFTTKGIGKGTGLGLSMVHGLAEQSGGRLVIDSAPGMGTTAEIWLPVLTGAAPEPSVSAQAAAEDIALPRGLRILAVDDDPLVRMTMCALLEDLGSVVAPASSGEDALRMIEAGTAFDLLVTDQVMPGMSGLALAEAVLAVRPSLPVVLASGYAELPLDRREGIVRLGKPFNKLQLIGAIMLAQARSGA